MKGKRIEAWQAALAVCVLGFLFCGGKAAAGALRTWREGRANAALVRQVRELSAGEEKYAPSGMLMKYDALYRQNNDLAGWLSIPDTPLDAPVMYTPGEPEKYLRMAFDGSYAISGSLFLGEGSRPDGSNVIVYGHNMKNGSMFGALPGYAGEEYAGAHPVIRLDTLTEEREYRVLAAFYAAVGEEESFPYYRYTDLTEEETFREYLAGVKERALWEPEGWPEPGTRLVTLSTCSYLGEDGRFVVVGAEVASGGQ